MGLPLRRSSACLLVSGHVSPNNLVYAQNTNANTQLQSAIVQCSAISKQDPMCSHVAHACAECSHAGSLHPALASCAHQPLQQADTRPLTCPESRWLRTPVLLDCPHPAPGRIYACTSSEVQLQVACRNAQCCRTCSLLVYTDTNRAP